MDIKFEELNKEKHQEEIEEFEETEAIKLEEAEYSSESHKLIYKDGEFVGYLELLRNSIRNIVILSYKREEGIGRKIIETLLEDFKILSGESLEVAKGFWKKIGATFPRDGNYFEIKK